MPTRKTNRLKFVHEEADEPPFCRFKLIDSDEIDSNHDLIGDVLSGELDGFVIQKVLNDKEVADVLTALSHLDENIWMRTPFGRNFPYPFAVIQDKGSSLESYFEHCEKLHLLIAEEPSVYRVFDRLNRILKSVGSRFDVSVPINEVKNAPVVPGTFRIMLPDLGGLFIHCGNLFQKQSQFFYSMLNSNLDMDNQLSYFVVLQNPEGGGELTLYDLLWKDVQHKDHPENNDYVIDLSGQRRYVSDLGQVAVQPMPGDLLIFHGGPIWHRVENIYGRIPRITLGGFINFSTNREHLYYWS